MALLERIESKSFLGEEFLTWLLWRSETRNGLIGDGDVEVHFGSPITLSAPFGDAEEVALKGDNVPAARELFAALGEGKLLAKAQTRWVISGTEWHVSIRGATLDFGGLKPPLKSAPPDPEWIARRVELLAEFGGRFDALFEAFLAQRLSDKVWAKETGEMRAWVAEMLGKARPEPPEVVELTDTEA
jgi:hypothetical protein